MKCQDNARCEYYRDANAGESRRCKRKAMVSRSDGKVYCRQHNRMMSQAQKS